MIAGLAATLASHEIIRPLNPSAELHKALVGEGSALEWRASRLREPARR